MSNHQLSLLTSPNNTKVAFRNIRNYLAGRHIGSTRDDALLDEVVKCLFYKIYIELGYTDDAPSGQDSLARAKHVRTVFGSIRKDFPEIFAADDDLLLGADAVEYVLDELNFSILNASADPIGDAFEVFVGSESRGRNGQFFTPRAVTDLLTELVDPQPGEKIIDPACGAGGFLASVLRHYHAQGESRTTLTSLADSLWGVDKDEYLSTLARKHVTLLSGGHPNIFCGDSLSMTDEACQPMRDIPVGEFDVLLTNPPFGSKIVSADKETMLKFHLAKKWKLNSSNGKWEPTNTYRPQVPPQILFIEQCINMVRDGGRMGIVIPESMVSNKTHRYVVQYLMEKTHIKAVVGMPEALFKTSGKGGTHTKTCLIVAEKDEARARGDTKIFMAEAQWCGHDSRAREIPFNDLPKIAENLNALRSGENIPHSPLGFLMPESDITSHILCPHYYDPRVQEDLAELTKTHELVSVADMLEEGTLSIRTGDELGKLAYGTGDIPFIRTSDFSNWEIKADAKHGVERAIYDKFSKKQDVRPYDIFMVRDGTYLIGTCAIVTPDNSELLFQSHIFKIRVNKNSHGITPFLLLAVLSSSIVQRQVRAKQFTQDIIDTLGDRLQELVLPIPKSMEQRDEITAMVEKAIEHRQKARSMTHEACLLVDKAHTGSRARLRNVS